MSRYAPDCRFLCQSSSMEFLSNHNFDFNKLFKHGIPFLTLPDEQVLRTELLNRYKQSCTQAGTSSSSSKAPNIIPIPDNHKTVIEDACEKVKELLENDTSSEIIVAENTNSFIRKLLYQEIQLKYSDDKVCMQTKIVEGVGNVMVAYKGRSRDLMAKERMEREQIELEKAVGFSAILKKIRNSNKPVVGHNMTLDVCHMIHQFCLPLPSVYDEFQDTVKLISPRFLDTKYMSGIEPLCGFFRSTVLNDLNKSLAEQCQDFTILEPEIPEVGYISDTSKLHDAGYDSYLTSSVFVNLCNFYGKIKDIKDQILPDSSYLKKYENKLFMIRYNEDPCLNLNGPEPKLQRDHVYHITFPSEWKTIDITNIFEPFTNVFIKYINDTSAWVALRDASQAKAMNIILPKLQNLHKNIVLLPWSVYYNLDSNTTTKSKRKINECSLTPSKDNLNKAKDEHAVGETPEKISRTMKGRRVSKGGNISPILEGDESVELDVDSSAVLNNSAVDFNNDTKATPSYAQTLKMKKASESTELKAIFPVASWD
ncbi:Hypothetical protein CINCED_3A018229 [Cinara cedri]|nr:Hypothetical protein CINCED_3A018229 [Cinara cedri]